MSTLRKKVFKNLIWTGLGQFSVQGLTFLTAAVLARLLSPEDFGLIGMVLVINAFLMILADAGLKTTVIQNQQFTALEHRQLLGLSWIIGISLVGIFIAIAPLVAWFFDEPRLVTLCFAISPALLFTGTAQVPMGVIEKQMGFKGRSIALFASALIASSVAILAAFQGLGYWALALQMVLRCTLLFVGLTGLARIAWIPAFNMQLYKQVFGYTGNITLFQIINYFHRNLDNILIGKFLGVIQLGLYTRAYALMSVMKQTLNAVITPVMHSAMASKQDDVDALRRAYGQVVVAILWLTAPIMGLMAAFADEVILLAWGSGFSEASVPFFWLALAGMHQGVFGTFGAVFAVRNKTKELLVCGTITTILFGASIAFGLQWGITGVAISYSVMSHLIFLPVLGFVWSVLLAGRLGCLLYSLIQPIAFGILSIALPAILIKTSWWSKNELPLIIAVSAFVLLLCLVFGGLDLKRRILN